MPPPTSSSGPLVEVELVPSSGLPLVPVEVELVPSSGLPPVPVEVEDVADSAAVVLLCPPPPDEVELVADSPSVSPRVEPTSFGGRSQATTPSAIAIT
ncbi:MAG: hypothetical protein IPK74_35080 [Deltaproteobacteria bacterium]|nr:hypothetical protein [Deltaproteobacteria bacterium]